ncbi:hypothetical protein PR202_ga22918 [Eleusine coracana subsp. coracana]|uniref:Uncharacterized protein n=1 Tax=Eleusine coracana subsp. coracana TaxID=191504 RepID=A0AAV5D4H5_ELECO|nr:hypothetical protein PR202_ga22918 [Eleusine coracana subsp. coracana]
MTSVVEKLTILLGGEFNLASDVRRGIRFMKDELCSMNAALQRLADVDDDQIDVQTIQWRSKVRELSYDIEDCVDRFMLLHGCDKAKKNFVKSTLRKIFPLWGDRQIAKEIQDLKARVIEEKERRDRYNVDQYINDMHQRVCLDPRAPTLYEEARDLVGIHGPREEIIGWLKDEERQLKVVSIFGIGGQGKTTLAMEAYRKTQEPFDCRASVTVSRALDINKLLRDILFQINRGEYDRSERYLIVIDDIWSVLDWEYVKSALPTNNNRNVAKAVVNNISHLRSFYLIISDQEELGTQVSHLLNGQVLQVLSIEGASTWGDHPERIGNFSRLKYLKIGEMVISKIPEEIGNLQHLEILDVRENLRIRELPASIVQLHKLVCLFIHKEVKLPSGIGNLQALEELSSVGLHRASVECIHELGRLTKLKALEILGVARDVEGRREACISSLSKLVTRSLRSLQFTGGFGSGFMNSWIVSCGSTTAQLRKLVLNVKFDFIPSRIGSLVNLTRLNFGVRGEVGEEGIKTLASLPVLLSLTVSLHTDFSGVIHPKHVIGRQGFQHLLKFNFNCQYDGALEFEAGAMPKLQSLKLKLQARFQFKYGNGGLLVGLPYLLGLKHIAVVNNCTNAVTEEVDTLENGIRDAAKTLPNYPVCEITREDQ